MSSFAPKHEPVLPEGDQTEEVEYSLHVLDWVRDTWEHRQWVDSRPEATAVVGHSLGTLLAARVRQARPTISALAGLSGPWLDFSDPSSELKAVMPPSFFMFTTDSHENLDDHGWWDDVPFGKTSARFEGEHFDYLDPNNWGCDVPRGACTKTDEMAAVLVASFISRHVPGSLSTIAVPPSLILPEVTLTLEQEFFAGNHLFNFDGTLHTNEAGCGIDLKWEDPEESDSRHIGP